MVSRKRRKSISVDELKEILEDVHAIAFKRETDRSWSFDFELAQPLLKDTGFSEHIVFFQVKAFPLRRHESKYDTRNLIIRNLDIELNTNLEFSKESRWSREPPHVKWHFENCHFRPSSPNMVTICFDWKGDFRFYNNVFDFSGFGMRSWLFVFDGLSSVLFQRNDFRRSNLQIPCTTVRESWTGPMLTWGGIGAYIVKDDSYYQAMIRENYRLPETVPLKIQGHGSDQLDEGPSTMSFIGNRGIDSLLLRCKASSYTFKGINHINNLNFTELDSNFDKLDSMYFGPRERIDPNYHNAPRHRRLFLELRKFGINAQDTELVKSIETHLSRIEYFLVKDQRVPFRFGGSEWIEYWQDRTLHEWRRWSTDFHKSWSRPLIIGMMGYLILNGFPKFWIDEFSISDWITFCLRRIDKIPFYTAGLEELYGSAYEDLPSGSKNWLRLIGLFQVVWTTMWGLAFSKTIRK